jgi:ParB/RepB/Spo0J family partition protein
MPLDYDDIIVPAGRRPINQQSVKRLADSIEKLGLRHPITVRSHGDKYYLVAGLHRMEACRKLGRPGVMANILTMGKDEARMWEIAENLHRADLTKLQRDEQIAEWVRLVSVKLTETKREGRPGAVAAAARELGVEESDVRRALQVDDLSDEAKDAAVEVGLDDNRSALLAAAAETTSEAQTSKIIDLAASKKNKVTDDPQEKWRKSFVKLCEKREADLEFAREWLDKPVMDRRFA